MQLRNNWPLYFAARIFSNALAGGLLIALVGALSVGVAGASIGAIFDFSSSPAQWDDGFMVPGAFVGATLGVWSGIIGALVCAGAAIASAPGPFYAPTIAPVKRIAAGQVAATIMALSTYLLLCLGLSQFGSASFLRTVEDNVMLILWGAPVMMICGAIAGALWKRDSVQSATLKAE